MKQFKRFWPVILVLALSAAFLLAMLRPSPIVVDVVAVTRGPLAVTVEEDGKTRVKERYVISAPLAGQMSRMELHAGDAVEAERTIITTISPTDPTLLDARSLSEAESRVSAAEAAQEQATARLDAARETHRLADDRWKRAKRLIVSSSISQAEYDQAEHEERIAAGSLRAAEFGYRVAQFELSLAQAAFIRTRPPNGSSTKQQRLDIRPPVDGQVLRVLQESAGVVMAGQPLLEVGNPRELEIEIDLLSADAAKTKPGAKVILQRWGGDTPLEARVRLVEPSGFTKISALGVEEQRVNVIADLVDTVTNTKERPAGLGDAFRVEASVVIWESDDVLKVPTGALFRHDDAWAVFVAHAGRVERRKVAIGQNNGQEAEVIEGLAINELVVEYPSDQVRDGARVAVRR